MSNDEVRWAQLKEIIVAAMDARPGEHMADVHAAWGVIIDRSEKIGVMDAAVLCGAFLAFAEDLAVSAKDDGEIGDVTKRVLFREATAIARGVVVEMLLDVEGLPTCPGCGSKAVLSSDRRHRCGRCKRRWSTR